MDGVDLQALVDNSMSSRLEPLFFWSFNIEGLAGRKRDPYIAPELQVGTTPLVKLMNGIATRNFQNLQYPVVDARDFDGPRVVLDNDYKLVIDGSVAPSVELFNLRDDPSEQHNLAGREPAVVRRLENQLREWQQSTLNSLTGADYR